MISKNKIKFINSLQKKKARDEERLFVIEGDKLVREFLDAKIPVKTLLAKPGFLKELPANLTGYINDIEDVSDKELKLISTLKTPQNALALIPMRDQQFNTNDILKELTAALDFIQDPGNLGTIIRAAAWFGIKNIICSENCVDVYNPKVIQASMGAIIHVNIFYYDLKKLLLSAAANTVPVYGTMLTGNSVYGHDLSKKGIILLGNESKGISNELMPLITDRIMIPGAIKNMPGIDSLNVGMAASVIFSEFHRRS